MVFKRINPGKINKDYVTKSAIVSFLTRACQFICYVIAGYMYGYIDKCMVYLHALYTLGICIKTSSKLYVFSLCVSCGCIPYAKHGSRHTMGMLLKIGRKRVFDNACQQRIVLSLTMDYK